MGMCAFTGLRMRVTNTLHFGNREKYQTLDVASAVNISLMEKFFKIRIVFLKQREKIKVCET